MPGARIASRPAPGRRRPARQTAAKLAGASKTTARRKVELTPGAAQPALPETLGTGAVVNVSTPGLAFPYPEYLRNIVQEVYRRWQRTLGNAALRAEVSFLVLRDGSVREIRLSRSSGNFSFDLSAQGAVEAAGGAGAFGPLPDVIRPMSSGIFLLHARTHEF
jgi:protein TonB